MIPLDNNLQNVSPLVPKILDNNCKIQIIIEDIVIATQAYIIDAVTAKIFKPRVQLPVNIYAITEF